MRWCSLLRHLVRHNFSSAMQSKLKNQLCISVSKICRSLLLMIKEIRWPIKASIKYVWPIRASITCIWPIRASITYTWPIRADIRYIWPIRAGIRYIWPIRAIIGYSWSTKTNNMGCMLLYFMLLIILIYWFCVRINFWRIVNTITRMRNLSFTLL